VFVDPTLGQPARQNAQDLVDDADRVVAANDKIFGTTGGPVSVIVFALNGATDGTGGADHMGCNYSQDTAIGGGGACGAESAWALRNASNFPEAALGRADDQGKAAGPAHYTVVLTEGHNLLVTDNATNKLYFYTTDKDKPIGTPLKLRASIELSKVGEEEIPINAINVEKVDK
jgi:hypothetical protein